MTAQPTPFTPISYLRRISDWTRRSNQGPMSWAHVALVSLEKAVAYSTYKEEPRLKTLHDGLRAQVQDGISNDGMAPLRDEALVEATRHFADYERGRPELPFMQDRFLRWLASRPPALEDDRSLEVWRRLLDKTGIEAEHFGGNREWSPAPTPAAQATAADSAGAEPEESPMVLLDRLIGLKRVKRQVRTLRDFLAVEAMREDRGLPKNGFSLHQVFLGNPGTGKTTVARILAGIYREFGFLSKGHLVEVDRAGLVGEFVGQTEKTTGEMIEKALGGILFIDEAYSLASGGKDDFGGRAIDILVKRMEDYSDDLVVVAAGYPDEMERFIRSNPGLRGRFTSYLHFDDYDDDQLTEIFLQRAEAAAYAIDEEAAQAAHICLAELRQSRGKDFANARDARTLWEATVRRLAARVMANHRATGQSIDHASLTTVVAEDVPKPEGDTRRVAPLHLT